MASVTIPEQDRTLTDVDEIGEFLAQYGIWYRRYEGDVGSLAGATDDEILAAFAEPVDNLKAEGGYVTADVINITPDLPNLDAMLAKFDKEHWHDEDEVRFIVEGNGLFHVNPGDDPVFRIEVSEGDLIKVPRGTHHWFHLCSDRRIKAIRLFQDPAGWTPHYTDSEIDTKFAPLCFGPSYIEPAGDIESVI